VALFPPHPDVEASGRGLRVSRYLDPIDGPPHTRLSIYGADGRVRCLVALDDESRTDLAQFLVVRVRTADLRLRCGAAFSTARSVA
jgi:hypothetical protein